MEYCIDQYTVSPEDGDHIIVVASDDGMNGNTLFPTIYYVYKNVETNVAKHDHFDAMA